MIPTSVTIREDQKKWINEHYFNLSRFVRDKLDEMIMYRKEMELNSVGLYTGTPNNIKEVDEEMGHECAECGRMFGNARGLRSHYSQMHPDSGRLRNEV